MNFLKKKLKNGITVVFEKRDLPVVSLAIVNKFGSAYESLENKGLAHFMEHLLFTGTKTRDHEDISREVEKKGGVLNAFTNNQVTAFWFKMPSEHVFSGLDILSDMLNNTLFKADKFEREKKVILEEIKMYHDDPRSYLEELIFSNLYEVPFGGWIIGSEKTVSSFKRDFVIKYFKKAYSPQNYFVVAVGNLDFDKLCSYIESKFSPSDNNILNLDVRKINKDSVEERAGIDQAHFVFGMHAPPLNDDLYYALKILNAYLTQGMSSRLFLKIREEKGLAYTISGTIEAEKDYSYYRIYVGTKKEAVDEVKKIILEEFENIKNMTQKQLDEIKEQIIGLRKLSSEESYNVLEMLVPYVLIDSPDSFYDFEKKIRKVSLEQVKKVAQIKKYSTASIVPK